MATRSAEEILRHLIDKGFYVNHEGCLEWKFIEGCNIQDSVGISSEELEPYISDEQRNDPDWRKPVE